MVAADVHRLVALQEKLYAQDEWAVLCVLQAMDAAGKDSTIKHVMSGVNPQGVQVTSFKAPGPEELAHDFLWRANRAPAGTRPYRHLQPQSLRGSAGGPRPSRTARAAAPAEGTDGQAAVGSTAGGDRRLRALSHAPGHCGAEVLPQRLEAGAEAPLPGTPGGDRTSTGSSARATWPSAPSGTNTRHAYQEAIAATATPHAPWFVVPADNKWFIAADRGRCDDRGH